jgi:hypothetical protein
MRFRKSLALVIVAFLILTASSANSEVIYSGILDISGPNFNVDINNDGKADFVTGWRTWAAGNGVSWNGFDTIINFDMQFINTELSLAPGFPGAKTPLAYGELIGGTLPPGWLWSNFSNDSMMWTYEDFWNNPSFTYSGIWHDQSDKYLGFRMAVGSDSFYGWIELGTDAVNNVTLVGYAYEGVPGTPITAGATSAPVPEPFAVLLLGMGLVGLVGFGKKLKQ